MIKKSAKRLFSYKGILPALCVLLAILSALSAAFAAAMWISDDITVNLISLGSVVEGQIVEEYNQGQTINPGQRVDKVVRIKNTGSIDSIVRVKVSLSWNDNQNTKSVLNVQNSRITDTILIDYNTDNWYYDSSDGYYYYKAVLKPGESTKPLFESFMLDGEKIDSSYSGKTGKIIVKTNLIQAAGNSASAWGTSLKKLGIEYKPAYKEKVTGIIFEDFDNGFLFDGDNEDLFANFKNLIPGETRTQTIKVTNNFEKPVKIFLYAELTKQEYTSPDTLELVYKLLKEYANIVITDEDGNTVYEGAVWGNLDSNANDATSMKHKKSLGEYKSKDVRKLNVSLSLSTEVDNSYKNLLGRVTWHLEAQGSADDPIFTEPPTLPEATSSEPTISDPSTPGSVNPTKNVVYDFPGDSVKTGMNTYVYMLISILLLTAAMIIILLYFYKKRKERKD